MSSVPVAAVMHVPANVERRGDPHQLLLLHRSADGEGRLLEPEEESDGTVVLLNFLHHALSALEAGSLLLVDELDRALHTRLAAELVRLFTSPDSNPHGAQLLLTTHDNGLLDVLRRDEVVFVDKDDAGRSTLTPASDFHLHKRDSARALYEAGRLGGVPRVTSMSRALRARLPVEGADGEE
jgi:AAA15 family ATPase/GTPase